MNDLTQVRTTGPTISATTPSADLTKSGGLVVFDWNGAGTPGYDGFSFDESFYTISGSLDSDLQVPSTVTCVTASVVVTWSGTGVPRELVMQHPNFLTQGLYFTHPGGTFPLQVYPGECSILGDPLTVGFAGSYGFAPAGGTITGTVSFNMGVTGITYSPITDPGLVTWSGTVAYYTGYGNG